MKNKDLIFKEYAIAAIIGFTKLGLAEFATDEIKKLPRVPAVPLDKLCELLADMGSGKNNTLCIECCGSEGGKCPAENCLCQNLDAWKRHLTKWMDGLE